MKKLYLWLFITAAFSLFACTKTAGPAGPAGPQGNANVQTVIFQNQGLVAGGTTQISVPAITQSILDSGAVVVYIQLSGSSSYPWIALPYYAPTSTYARFDIELGQALVFSSFGGNFNVKIEVIAGK